MKNDDLKALQGKPIGFLKEVEQSKKYLALQKDLGEYLLEGGLLKKGQTLTSAIQDKSLNVSSKVKSQYQSLTFTRENKSLEFSLKWNKPYTPEVSLTINDNTSVEVSLSKTLYTDSNNPRQRTFNERCLVDYSNHPKYHVCSRKYPPNPWYKVIVSEGDSWFQHPLTTDIIDHIMRDLTISEDSVVRSLGAAGDTLKGMVKDQQYMDPIREYNTDIFLFSGGGNDLLLDIKRFFNKNKKIDNNKVNKVLKNEIGRYYNKMFASLTKVSKDLGVDTICHGYDYIIPRENGWVGSQLATMGIKEDSWKGITDALINEFNKKLSSIAKKYTQVHYVDLRNKVGNKNWFDEIHPNYDGSKKTASCIMEKIKELRGN